jgi:MoaA/NifB/PqqE/SkfB family radical SAM enzyme
MIPMQKFKHLTVCLDMYGCPNRCSHCWLGVTPNGNLSEDDLRFVAEQFRPFGETMELYDWYREPDYHANYRELWQLTAELSDVKTPHYELISYWRAVRDDTYLDWLRSIGLKAAQLTLFGGEATTDRYVGRPGAYREIVKTMELLMDKAITPRIQVFVNKETVDELGQVETLIRELDLENRCAGFAVPFAVFVHAGSCDGENEKHYDIRVTAEDLAKIPPYLAQATVRYFQRPDLQAVFGRSEQAWCAEAANDEHTMDLVSDSPVFYVDRQFDVYPNVTAPAPWWKLGNLKTDGAQAILRRYAENDTLAQRTSLTVPTKALVRACGDPESRRLFGFGDYMTYLLNRYCRENMCK